MAALLRAVADRPELLAPEVVVSPRAGTPAALRAGEAGVPVAIAPSPGDLGAALAGCDLVCLAGYARLVPPDVVESFAGRMLNVHPALLPKFGGKGMWGARVHEAVLASGDAESGCTVHLVDERYDRGEVLLRMRCPVLPGDTPETLGARVLALEHLAYPQALLALAERMVS